MGECIGDLSLMWLLYSLISNQALGSHGVTLQNPPKNDLFACFHKSQNVHSTPDPVNLVSGYTFPAFPPPWASMYDPRMFISQAPPGYASSLPPSDLQRDHP